MNQITAQSLPVITAATERIRLRIRRTSEDVIEIGRDLTLLKQELGHGNFLPYIKEQFEMPYRMAAIFMNAYEKFGKCEIISHLKPTILYEISFESTPESVREYVIDQAKQGNQLSVAEVKRLKLEAKAEARMELEAEAKAEAESIQRQIQVKDQIIAQHAVIVSKKEQEKRELQELISKMELEKKIKKHFGLQKEESYKLMQPFEQTVLSCCCPLCFSDDRRTDIP